MKNQMQVPADERLGALLREARPAPDLPLGFRNAVWRRLEKAQAPDSTLSVTDWLDRVAGWVLRPRLALAGAAAMLLLGAFIGLLQSDPLANELAKRQYLAAVSPLTSR